MELGTLIVSLLTLLGVLVNITRDFWVEKFKFRNAKHGKSLDFMNNHYKPRLLKRLEMIANLLDKSFVLAGEVQHLPEHIDEGDNSETGLDTKEMKENIEEELEIAEEELENIQKQLKVVQKQKEHADNVLDLIRIQGQVFYLDRFLGFNDHFRKIYVKYIYSLDMEELDSKTNDDDSYYYIYMSLMQYLEIALYRIHMLDNDEMMEKLNSFEEVEINIITGSQA